MKLWSIFGMSQSQRMALAESYLVNFHVCVLDAFYKDWCKSISCNTISSFATELSISTSTTHVKISVLGDESGVTTSTNDFLNWMFESNLFRCSQRVLAVMGKLSILSVTPSENGSVLWQSSVMFLTAWEVYDLESGRNWANLLRCSWFTSIVYKSKLTISIVSKWEEVTFIIKDKGVIISAFDLNNAREFLNLFRNSDILIVTVSKSTSLSFTPWV